VLGINDVPAPDCADEFKRWHKGEACKWLVRRVSGNKETIGVIEA
jgi:hypothetical protein